MKIKHINIIYGRIFAIIIVLISVSLLVAGLVRFPHLPYRHHPLFPLDVILFVIADCILIVAGIFALRTFSYPKRKYRKKTK